VVHIFTLSEQSHHIFTPIEQSHHTFTLSEQSHHIFTLNEQSHHIFTLSEQSNIHTHSRLDIDSLIKVAGHSKDIGPNLPY
jgi:hypothetical protein